MSEPLTVYVDMFSEPSQTVLAFLKLSNVPFETKLIILGAGEHLTPEFTKINPAQEVPAITHGDYNLAESAAIVAYIAETYSLDNQWYPKDLKIRARINAYIHWHHINIRNRIGDYLMKKIISPMFLGGSEITEAEESAARQVALNAVADFEWQLGETGYAGRTTHATVADVFAYNEIANLSALGIELQEGSRVRKWFEEIGSIAIVQEQRAEAVAFYSSIGKKESS